MNTEIIKQEILLMVAPFSSYEFCETNAPKIFRHESFEAQLEKACWNGLLDELLNGIVEKTSSGKRLCIWNIHKEKSFLEIELCNHLYTAEKYLSVNPYIFLPTMSQS